MAQMTLRTGDSFTDKSVPIRGQTVHWRFAPTDNASFNSQAWVRCLASKVPTVDGLLRCFAGCAAGVNFLLLDLSSDYLEAAAITEVSVMKFRQLLLYRRNSRLGVTKKIGAKASPGISVGIKIVSVDGIDDLCRQVGRTAR